LEAIFVHFWLSFDLDFLLPLEGILFCYNIEPSKAQGVAEFGTKSAPNQNYTYC